MLLVTQTSAGLLAAAVFAVLTGTHEIRLWSVYLLADRARLRQRLRQPRAAERSSPRWSRPDDLPNAVTLNSVVDEHGAGLRRRASAGVLAPRSA